MRIAAIGSVVVVLSSCVAWHPQELGTSGVLQGGPIEVRVVTTGDDTIPMRDPIIRGDTLHGWSKGTVWPLAIAVADVETVLSPSPNPVPAMAAGVPLGVAAVVGFFYAMAYVLGPGN